jgi:hypothetical protein
VIIIRSMLVKSVDERRREPERHRAVEGVSILRVVARPVMEEDADTMPKCHSMSLDVNNKVAAIPCRAMRGALVPGAACTGSLRVSEGL